MSSSVAKGARLHGYSTPTNPDVVFETPLALTKGSMFGGETVTTSGIDGHDFTATFHGLEACEILWVADWDECARITLESQPAGHWLTGTYWAVAGFNIVARQQAADTGRWELSFAVWEP